MTKKESFVINVLNKERESMKKSLINYDSFDKEKEELKNRLSMRHPLPEPVPCSYPEGITKEDIYPSGRTYKGD